jgi:DNA invertase Pin-like site-specific DNA recombinase
MTSPTLAIAYLRQSVARDDSVSLELQETACRDYAQRAGYRVIDVVADPGRTGRTLARRQVAATIERVAAGQAQVIIVWRWSRLARSRRDFAVCCDEVARFGGRIESATEPIDVRTASGRLARGMMAEVAAWESEQKGEVWREVHARRRRLGLPATGGDRFGYLRTGDIYTVDPVTGLVLAQMYYWYLEGAGFTLIAKRLNREGHTTLRGGAWNRTSVMQLLESGFGVGLIVNGSRRRRAYDHLPGAHEAVITAQEWAQYRALRTTRTGPSQPREPTYVLSGLLRCGDCGRCLHPASWRGRPGYTYQCGAWARAGTCRCVSVSRARAEAAVLAWLARQASDVDAAARAKAAAVALAARAQRVGASLARRVAMLDARLVKLTLGWTEGTVPDDAYHAARDQLQQQRAGLSETLAAAERQAGTMPPRPVPPGVLAAWSELSVVEQRAILAPLIERIRIVRPANAPAGRRPRVQIEIHAAWGEIWVAPYVSTPRRRVSSEQGDSASDM